MKSEGLLQPFSNTPGQINQYLALAQQQASMTLGTSAAANTIKAFLKGTLTAHDRWHRHLRRRPRHRPDRAGGRRVPGPGGTGQGPCVGRRLLRAEQDKPEVQAASWEFAKFMLQPENAAYWNLHGGYLPMVKAAVQLPEVQTYWEDDLAGQMSKVAYDQLGAVDIFKPGPLIGPYTAWSDGVEKMWDSTLLGSTPPDKALANGEKSTTEVLKDYNG